MKSGYGLIGAAVAVASVVWAGSYAQGRDARPVEPSAVSALIVESTNALRREQGRTPVAPDEHLTSAARAFAQWMAEHDRIGHEVDGSTPSERANRHGYAFCIVTENVAYQYDSSGFRPEALARALVEGWSNSAGHRRNMLDADVVDIGVGVAQSPKTGRWYAVQKFGLPDSARIRFDVVNRVGETVRYRVGDRSFTLGPRVTRTHERCRPADLRIETPGGQPAATALAPKGGERYAVVRDGSGTGWRVERE